MDDDFDTELVDSEGTPGVESSAVELTVRKADTTPTVEDVTKNEDKAEEESNEDNERTYQSMRLRPQPRREYNVFAINWHVSRGDSHATLWGE